MSSDEADDPAHVTVIVFAALGFRSAQDRGDPAAGGSPDRLAVRALLADAPAFVSREPGVDLVGVHVDQRAVLDAFRACVNMAPKALEEWLATEESQAVGSKPADGGEDR